MPIRSLMRAALRVLAADCVAISIVFGTYLLMTGGALPSAGTLYIVWLFLLAGVARHISSRVEKWLRRRGEQKIQPAPGALWMSILTILYSKKVRERVFVPVISDMRVEHAEALLAGKPRLARWVHIRGVIVLVFTMAFHLVSSVGQAALKIWSASK